MATPPDDTVIESDVPVWHGAIRRSLGVFFPIGLFFIVALTIAAIFHFIPFSFILLAIAVLLSFWLGKKHGKADRESDAEGKATWIRLGIGLIGFLITFALYIGLLAVLKADISFYIWVGIAVLGIITAVYYLGYYEFFTSNREPTDTDNTQP